MIIHTNTAVRVVLAMPTLSLPVSMSTIRQEAPPTSCFPSYPTELPIRAAGINGNLFVEPKPCFTERNPTAGRTVLRKQKEVDYFVAEKHLRIKKI